MPTTPVFTDGTPLRVWLSDADLAGAPRDETLSRWSTQRGKINAVGVAATSYFNSSNQSLVLPSSDPGSYTFIASDGGSLDVSTLGGTSPFPVEQDAPGHLRLIELRVSGANPKPLSTQVGSFDVAVDGSQNVSVKFTAGVSAPTFTLQPVSQTAECGSSATFSVSATGDGPVSYQWYFGASAIGGATGSTLTLGAVSSANSGTYSAVASNAGGSATSSVVTLTVVDTTPVSLAIQKVGTNAIIISWPQTCASYTLEQTDALTPPLTIWSPTGVAPTIVSGHWQVMLTTSGTKAFYRLRRP
jgi:hypothetical protein